MRDFNESRTYVQHLLAEHSRLHKMLLAARKEMNQASKRTRRLGGSRSIDSAPGAGRAGMPLP